MPHHAPIIGHVNRVCPTIRHMGRFCTLIRGAPGKFCGRTLPSRKAWGRSLPRHKGMQAGSTLGEGMPSYFAPPQDILVSFMRLLCSVARCSCFVLLIPPPPPEHLVEVIGSQL